MAAGCENRRLVHVEIMTTSRTAPWKKPAPKKMSKTKLSPQSIARAKAAAKKAGRRYPNLVDNMAAARKQREESQPKKKTTRSRRDHP
jgi:hypothetical protein